MGSAARCATVTAMPMASGPGARVVHSSTFARGVPVDTRRVFLLHPPYEQTLRTPRPSPPIPHMSKQSGRRIRPHPPTPL